MNKNKISRYARIAFLACTLLAALLQVLAVLLKYDTTSNYFQTGSILPTLATSLALISAIFGSLAAYLTEKNEIAASPFPSKRFPGPAVFGFLAAILFLFIFGRNRSLSQLGVIAAVLLICSALYGALINLEKFRREHTVLLILLGIGAIFACIFLTIYYYFDMSVEMNTPFKLTIQTALLCIMLYYTAEIRYLLDRPHPRFYLTLISWVIAIGALSAAAVPAAFLSDKLDRLDYLAGALIVLCVMLVAFNRMRNLLKEEEAPSTEEVTNSTEEDTKQ